MSTPPTVEVTPEGPAGRFDSHQRRRPNQVWNRTKAHRDRNAPRRNPDGQLNGASLMNRTMTDSEAPVARWASQSYGATEACGTKGLGGETLPDTDFGIAQSGLSL
jgi:hypothetical protein